MQGGRMLRGESLGRVTDLDWQPRGAGDLDGNGSPDLIWQNVATRQVAVWLMNGTALLEGRILDGPSLSSADWQVVSPK